MLGVPAGKKQLDSSADSRTAGLFVMHPLVKSDISFTSLLYPTHS